MVEVRWNVPEVVDTEEYTKTRILRSPSEQAGHQPITEIDSVVDSEAQTRWTDPNGTSEHFYVIRFYDPTTKKEYLDFALGYFPLTPMERRLIDYLRQWVPDAFDPDLSDGTLATALRLSRNMFNVQPPETYYAWNNFPANYEQFLIMGAQINVAMLKYLKFAIRDFSYTDMGFSMNIDRGTKIDTAIKTLDEKYKTTMALSKMNFTHQGLGLGTVPLPISFGGQISRNLLNVADIFTALGR